MKYQDDKAVVPKKEMVRVSHMERLPTQVALPLRPAHRTH